MVLQRSVKYGFNGYHAPVVPRASRSPRGRRLIGKKCGNNQIHAFEVLASVAGNLLKDGEFVSPDAACIKDQHNGVKSTVKQEEENGSHLLEADLSGYMLNEFLHIQDNFSFNGSLASENFDNSEKIYVDEKFTSAKRKASCRNFSSKVGEDSSHGWKLFEGQLGEAIEIKPKAELLNIESTENEICLSKDSFADDAMEIKLDPSAQVSSENKAKSCLFRNCRSDPFSGDSANVKVNGKEECKNSVGCSNCGTIVKTYNLSYTRGQRRNLTASKHWRDASNLKVGDCFKAGKCLIQDGKTKPSYHNGRTTYNHQRSQKIFPFKKRKFFYESSLSTSDETCHCEDVINSNERRTNGDDCGPGAATGASSSVAGQQECPDSRDCNVKFAIKSFKVPELFIEIPTTATVGSLKRTVMEAVTAIIGDGLHVGILLQGKKVRDDSKTLLQTGISQDSDHRGLGFSLEPRHAQIVPSHHNENPSLLSGGTLGDWPRHTKSLKQRLGTPSASHVPPQANFGSGLDLVPSIAGTSTDNKVSDSQALVAVPALSVKALAVVPYNSKSRQPENGQRRTRRPFSVSEVEVLVQAVEKLGTGRWRDVKLRAFDNVNHRTYVDLKDKWKTLVHTARISPQQRRGEPVPQELLDRVLAAHAYWSKQQAKQQRKASI